MMYFSWNPGTVVDEEGLPVVAGRVTVFVHDSNVLADIYTLEGMDYTPLANPLFLDDYGRLSATVFAELGVYDVKVEKANGDGTYEDFDHFEIGIDAKLDQVGRDSVSSIEELMDLDPSVSSNIVTVESYPVRNYLWDPDAIDTPDGGVVVDSDVADHGRWLLLWDCPYLPSSVYGVKEGDVTNINALFNYASVIGSMNIHTPPAIRLEAAHYPIDGYLVCTKHLAVDAATTFTGTIALYDDVEFFGHSEPGHAVGDFDFLHTGCTAHSSWYFDITRFWQSGADILHVDNVNYFSSSVLKSTVNLSGKTVTGPGTKVTSYSNGSYFRVALDSSVPDNFFQAGSDFVRVTSNAFGDNLFNTAGSWDPGPINQGHHVQFDMVPDLDLFQDTGRWVAVMIERRNRLSFQQWDESVLDLQGRSCDGLYIGQQCFSTIRNAIIKNVTLAGYSTTFDNFKGAIMVNSNVGAMLTLKDSDITIPQLGTTGLTGIDSVNSNIVVGGTIDPCNCALSVYGGTWSGRVRMDDAHCDAYLPSGQVAFRNVLISGNHIWRLNRIYMVGCTSSCPVDLYPSSSGGAEYSYDCTLEDNQFLGNFRLWITMYSTQASPHYDVSGTNVKFGTMTIVNNRFDGADALGVKMLHLHPRSSAIYCCTDSNHLDMGTWRYEKNTGNCPKMTPGRLGGRTNWEYEWHDNYPQISYRRSLETFNIFMPYYYQHIDGTADMPNAYLDPADPSQKVTAVIHGRDWNDSWAHAYFWNVWSAPLDDEDANNRLVGYVWLSRDMTSTPNWHDTGNTPEGQAYETLFNFELPNRHA